MVLTSPCHAKRAQVRAQKLSAKKGDNMIRVMALMCCLLVVSTLSGGVGAGESDPDSINLVRTALSLRTGGKQIIIARHQKYLARLGDGVSVALLKILDDSSITDAAFARGVLSVIRDAFSEPQLISAESNKTPTVTVLLLDRMGKLAVNAQVQEEITQTIDFVGRAK
jgi:hypothetical protein